VCREDNLATFMCRFSRNPGSLKLLEPSGRVQIYANHGILRNEAAGPCKMLVTLYQTDAGHNIERAGVPLTG
jgi:hypothetical protein